MNDWAVTRYMIRWSAANFIIMGAGILVMQNQWQGGLLAGWMIVSWSAMVLTTYQPEIELADSDQELIDRKEERDKELKFLARMLRDTGPRYHQWKTWLRLGL